MLLDLNALANIDDIKTKEIDMQKEWGGNIKIKAFDFAHQIDFEKRKKEIANDASLILLMIQLSVVDDENNLMFNDETIKVLEKRNSNSLLKVFNECLKINALDDKGIENKAKNS